MIISPRFLDEVRNRLTLSDVIGQRIKVTRAGREFKACCPFHKEKTPSFTINDDKQFYHCFGCGAHGDAIGFTMQHDNLSFIDAVEKLSALAGLQMPKPDPQAIKRAEITKDLYALMDAATLWFEAQLNAPENAHVLKYMIERGLRPETLSAFRVGYAPADRQVMRAHLKAQGFSDAQMIEAGVLRASNKGGEPYAFFRERVMFPVSDRRGRVVAYGGRILPDHMRPPDRGDYVPAKYMNSSDTPLFDKGRMLYGESLARQAGIEGKAVIVTEGYMDVIACHQAGFRGAVAPMGTALTEDQVLSLWKMIVSEEKVPILCFDGDDAGRRAASRSCERILPLLQPGQSVRFAFLPDGEDPDTLLRGHGAQALQKILDGALSLFDFIWTAHTAGRKFDTPESRAGLSKALENQIRAIADMDVQTHYRAQLRQKISEAFFQRTSNARRNNKGYNTPTKPSLKIRKPMFDKSNRHAQIILAAIINHPHIYDELEDFIGCYVINDLGLDNLRQTLISLLEVQDLQSAQLQEILCEKGFQQEVGDTLNESVYVHAAFSSPRFDSAEVLSTMQCWLSEVQDRDWSEEIKSGWKDAFRSADKEQEEQLRQMIEIKKASDNG